MLVLAALANLAFIVAGTVVGFRIHAISRRTHGVAERTIGLGLIWICAVGYPGALLAGVEALPELLRRLSTGVSALGIAVGAVYIALFVQRVFRPEAPWARGLYWALAAAWGVIAGLGLHAAVSAPVSEMMPIHGPRFLLGQALMFVLFGWSASESGLYWLKMRKRRKLGLAEPALVNRFALWAISGVASILSTTATTLTGLRGVSPLDDPATLLVMAGSGLVSAAAMVLAFMPPPAYQAWLGRQRS